MSQEPPQIACRKGTRLIPWLAPEDARMLAQLSDALGPGAMREMSNLLGRQAYEQRNYGRQFHSRDPDAVSAAADRTVISPYGAGGGRSQRHADGRREAAMHPDPLDRQA